MTKLTTALFVLALVPMPTFAQTLSAPRNLQVDGLPAIPPPTTRSCPPLPAFPDQNCTGVTPGTILTIVSGDQTYGSTFNGQTISDKDFRGIVKVTGANITFKNCIFRGRDVTNFNTGLIDTQSSTGTITLQDIEVVPSHPSVRLDGMSLKNTNVYRAYVHGGVDGIKTFGNVLIEDSYIHGMQWYANDPSHGGTPTHNDGVQSWNGPANTTLRHNNIDMSYVVDVLAPGQPLVARANAAWQDSSPNSRAEYNKLDGGGCTLNFAMSSLSSAIYVIGNRFGRHSFYQCPILLNLTSNLTQNSGNVWDDTGAPIPAPQQHN